MAWDPLGSNRDLRCILLNIEGNSHVLHFLLDCVIPERSSGLGVDVHCSLDRHWKLNSELLSLLPETIIDSTDDSVSLLEGMARNPPRECWLRYELVGNSIELRILLIG